MRMQRHEGLQLKTIRNKNDRILIKIIIIKKRRNEFVNPREIKAILVAVQK